LHDLPAGTVTDPIQWKPLSPAFTSAVRAYNSASRVRLRNAEVRNAPTAPLYHYTSRGGLEGIIAAQQIWFTHYQHLNDDTELQFGMDVAKATLSEIGVRAPKASIFCNMVTDLFSAENVNTAFGFYVASFSRNRDDLHQWRKYGQNGQGFAIGLAPKLFAIEETPDRQPHENVFVSPVTYGADAGRLLHLPAIESAVRIVLETVNRKAKAMSDINRGMPFFREMATSLLASELILNSLIVKHMSWAPEDEVRLFILGENAKLAPYVSMRSRSMETALFVPYIKSQMPLHQIGSIVEIVIGPDAPSDAEDVACSLLAGFHGDPRSIVRKSTPPFCAA
jgi:Protein of unknown function (DUF2971)